VNVSIAVGASVVITGGAGVTVGVAVIGAASTDADMGTVTDGAVISWALLWF
jgi:hypothetical protein